MCFAPKRRTLFRHLNVKKWYGPSVFLHFWLGNVLRATTTCTFLTSELPRVVRTLCFVYFDFDMCFVPQRRAIFHLIWPDGSAPAALASRLFDHPEPQFIGKTEWIVTLLPFRAPAAFPSVHIVGSLTSKLPSTIHTLHYTTLHYITLHYITFTFTLQFIYMYMYITLRYITTHYNYNNTFTSIHHITSHYISLHYMHCIALHYVTLHSTTLHAMHCIALQALHHCIALRYIALHCVTATFACTSALHIITLHTSIHLYITSHHITLH